jgi:cytochrome P450
LAEPTVPTPRQLTGLAALRCGWQLARDQIRATRRVYDAYGPFVIAGNGLPFVRHARTVLIGAPLIFTAGVAFNREVLNSTAWRPVSLLPGGPRNSAARRLSENLTRMTGPRHAHYRKLLTPPLRKATVDVMAEDMAALAEQELTSWPLGEIVDLEALIHRLIRLIAVGLLFGGDAARGYPVADMTSHLMDLKWSVGAMSFPVDLPFTPYGRSLREAEALERAALGWAESKRGSTDARDLVSIIVNSPDAEGRPTESASIARSLPALVTMTYEACQSTLIWTLILLDQHPQIARDLLDELAHADPSIEASLRLPKLEATIKESMRVLPPVPLQMRVAEEDTTLLGHPVPKHARLLLNAFLGNRAGDLYPQPERFIPERWSTIDPKPYEYLVFGAGPRQCPGFTFAMNVLKIALATILKRYRISLSPNARIDYRVQPTLRPVTAVPAIINVQDGAFTAAPIAGSIRDLVMLS